MPKQRCLIAYPLISAEDEIYQREFLREFRMLISTVGFHAVSQEVFNQKKIHPATLISKDRLKELARKASQINVSAIAFLGVLSPTQKFNAESILSEYDVGVMDREEIIIEIFNLHAKTKEAQLQVELARYRYLLPRLKGKNDLSRLGAGISTRGPGEQALEYERRLLKKHISRLNSRIKKLSIQYREQGKKRHGVFQAALCGYANSGKTTILNLLAKHDAEAKNKPFATLDTLVKKSWVGSDNVLLVDTIGFIRELPKGLELAFRTTMDILNQVDVIMVVYDLSAKDLGVQMRTVEKHLESIMDSPVPVVKVFNKLDLKAARNRLPAYLKRFSEDYFISARTGEGVENLKEMLNYSAERLK